MPKHPYMMTSAPHEKIVFDQVEAERPLLTPVEIAAHFGVAVTTVRGWVRDERVPFIRPSRRVVRFRLSEVERAITYGPTIKAPA